MMGLFAPLKRLEPDAPTDAEILDRVERACNREPDSAEKTANLMKLFGRDWHRVLEWARSRR